MQWKHRVLSVQAQKNSNNKKYKKFSGEIPPMKTLLRSSLLALLAVGAFAGVATQTNAKFNTAGAPSPAGCKCTSSTSYK
jgi:hypothetical protein